MKITVFGASGKVGRLLVQELLNRGHTVTAFVHSNTQAFSESPRLHIAIGDVHSQQDIRNALRDSEAVISTLGSWGTPSKDIVSAATENLIPIMNEKSILKFISVTGAAARVPGEKLNPVARLNRFVLGLVARPILRDAEKHLKLLHASKLNWVALRSPVMTSGKQTDYKISHTSPTPWATVRRYAVVHALADCIEVNSYDKSAPFITNK